MTTVFIGAGRRSWIVGGKQIIWGKTFALSHIAQCRFAFDDIIVVLRFAVLRDAYEPPLRIAEHVIVFLRGFL
jgi:hypothetical protein